MTEIIPNNLLKQIEGGENTVTEFKRAYDSLPGNIFETVCGMLNRCGGHIFLGVENDGTIPKGVDENSVEKLKRDFVNLCNNSQKIFPTIHIELHDYLVDDKIILYAYVYESSDVHKTANKIFDRNEDGDYDITCNTHLVSQMYIRKSSSYIENTIYPYARMEDLRADLIKRARQMAINRNSNHPWGEMSDEELIRSAGLFDRDIQTGKEGINLAGVLLLGKDETIRSALSYHRTDALLRVHDLERYDDRDDIRTNLIESYDRLMAFVKKHTNDMFYLEGTQRIDVRSKIARELCANMLIHREFSNPLPARLIITKESITTINANRPKFIGYIDVSSFSPFPKNPKIAGFFKEIGNADELGSGIRKMVRYSRIYTGTDPVFLEDEAFTATVRLTGEKRLEKAPFNLSDAVVRFIVENGSVSRKEIDEFVFPLLNGYSDAEKSKKVHSTITSLSKRGKIRNDGIDKSPKWSYCGPNNDDTQ